LVGVGEASYCSIAPSIIADLFTDNARTIAMTTFYFAMPVGWYMHDHELLYLLLYSFITSLSTSERKLDIGLHLAKLRTTDLNVN